MASRGIKPDQVVPHPPPPLSITLEVPVVTVLQKETLISSQYQCTKSLHCHSFHPTSFALSSLSLYSENVSIDFALLMVCFCSCKPVVKSLPSAPSDQDKTFLLIPELLQIHLSSVQMTTIELFKLLH